MDRKIESTEVEIQANISELQRVDKNAVWDDPNSKIQGLEERLSQMRKNFEEANIRTVGGLVRKSQDDILALDGIGPKGLEEIVALLTKMGVSLAE